MRYLGALMVLSSGMLGGCSQDRPAPPEATHFITPEERARMPVEEREDPYVIKHVQKGTAALTARP